MGIMKGLTSTFGNPKNRDLLGFIPALIMGSISMITFVAGLSFDNQNNLAFWAGVGLAVSNSIIQVIGNDKPIKSMGAIFGLSWIASYVLGITTSTFMLHEWFKIDNQLIEWTIAVTLGTMVEVVPEKAFLIAMKSLLTYTPKTTQPYGQKQNHATKYHGKEQQTSKSIELVIDRPKTNRYDGQGRNSALSNRDRANANAHNMPKSNETRVSHDDIERKKEEILKRIAESRSDPTYGNRQVISPVFQRENKDGWGEK